MFFCNAFQIEMDFETLFDVQDNLYLKWTPSFADRVIVYANQQAKWQEYLNVDATTSTPVRHHLAFTL